MDWFKENDIIIDLDKLQTILVSKNRSNITHEQCNMDYQTSLA